MELAAFRRTKDSCTLAGTGKDEHTYTAIPMLQLPQQRPAETGVPISKFTGHMRLHSVKERR